MILLKSIADTDTDTDADTFVHNVTGDLRWRIGGTLPLGIPRPVLFFKPRGSGFFDANPGAPGAGFGVCICGIEN